MLYDSSDTLSWFQDSPYFSPLEVGGVSCSHVAINCSPLRDTKMASPDAEAIEFYCMNHLYSVVRETFGLTETLPDWAVSVCKTYLDVLERQSKRMMYYMALIITRESRHASNVPETALSEKYGEKCVSFILSVKGSGSNGAAAKFDQKPPETDLATYARCVSDVFFQSKFSAGYGGKPWGVIAETLARMLEGEISMEMMLDTAYTLAHNNGPMFNKGMLYEGYTYTLYRILDIQRSGQIPEMLINRKVSGVATHISEDVAIALNRVLKALPEKFGAHVNWQQVKDLGALKDYSQEIAKQAAEAALVKEKELAAIKAKKVPAGYVVAGTYGLTKATQFVTLTRTHTADLAEAM